MEIKFDVIEESMKEKNCKKQKEKWKDSFGL
jgi:hypothetical protein